jgi:transposase
MQAVIELVNQNLRTTLIEIITLGRSLTKCADEGLATSTDAAPARAPPTPSAAASNTSAAPALRFRNTTNSLARSLVETGGLDPDDTLESEEPVRLSAG